MRFIQVLPVGMYKRFQFCWETPPLVGGPRVHHTRAPQPIAWALGKACESAAATTRAAALAAVVLAAIVVFAITFALFGIHDFSFVESILLASCLNRSAT